jgi:hypothetical protein
VFRVQVLEGNRNTFAAGRQGAAAASVFFSLSARFVRRCGSVRLFFLGPRLVWLRADRRALSSAGCIAGDRSPHRKTGGAESWDAPPPPAASNALERSVSRLFRERVHVFTGIEPRQASILAGAPVRLCVCVCLSVFTGIEPRRASILAGVASVSL